MQREPGRCGMDHRNRTGQLHTVSGAEDIGIICVSFDLVEKRRR